MQWLLVQVVPALREVCTVFGYDVRFVTLFHQPGSVSRFVRQRLLLNTAPVLDRYKGVLRAQGIKDVRADPEGFTFCYFYGLLIHKLGHFHDIVHGTRHDFMMNELRIEFLMTWLDYLEDHGFDPAELEMGEFGRFLKFPGVKPQNTGANVDKNYVSFIGGAL